MAGIQFAGGGDLSTGPPVPFFDLVGQYEPIREEIRTVVDRVFSDQQFILGDEVAEFECDLANYCDSHDAIGCGSGTDALTLSLMALDIGPGDEVITSPFTFFATAGAICRTGATPVFVDIDPIHFNLDPSAVESAITKNTRAIIPVHLFGQCADMEPLWRLAVRSGLAIVEDACQAIGAEYRSRRAGVLGTLGCFSFFPTKNLGGAGDGGAITTDDPQLASRLRRLRVHGEMGRYRHTEIGFNSRLDALQAAVLRVKLRYLEVWTEKRRQHARRYADLIARYGVDDLIELPRELPDRRHVFNQYSIRVNLGHRDDVLRELRARHIGCNVYYPVPLHLQECFENLGYRLGDFPIAERTAQQVIALPIFPELKAEQQEAVVQCIAAALGREEKPIDSSDTAADNRAA